MAQPEEKNSDFELEPKPERSDQLPEDVPAERDADDDADDADAREEG